MKLSNGRLEYERSFHDDDYGRRKEREKNFRHLVQESWNIDDALFRLCPFLKKYSWIVVLTFLKE